MNTSPQRQTCLKLFQNKSLIRLACTSMIGLLPLAGVPRAAIGAPLDLSDRQLDVVTAGAANMELALTAKAEGPTAIASTAGTVQSAGAPILLVRVSPGTPQDVALVGNAPATLFFAHGSATAAGAAGADCAGNIETSGNFAYLTEASMQTQTIGPAGFPTAVNCNCAAFGIALNR